MVRLQELIGSTLVIRLGSLYTEFVKAAGAEMDGPQFDQSVPPTEKELEIQCVIPRVLNIVQQAEKLLADGTFSVEVVSDDELLQSLNNTISVMKHCINDFHSTLLKHQPIPLQVNGHDKYPILMKDIEQIEKNWSQFRAPEPFDLPPLPSNAGPTLQQSQNNTYDDVPLLTRSSIRLVHLNTTPDESIDVTLRTVDLDDNPSYATLSYTWGPPFTVFRTDRERRETQSQLDNPLSQITVPITCNGKGIRVRENLYRFLCRWRDGSILTPAEDKPNKERGIWIDAICINQDNLDEKNDQVAMMGEIYGKSWGTFIWLGEEDCFSQIAIPLLEELTMFSGDWNSLRNWSWEDVNNDLLKRGLPFIPSWDFVCLFAFLRRSWFRRAWITQEFALTPQLWLFCGDVIIPDWRIPTNAVMYLDLAGMTPILDTTVFCEILDADYEDRNPKTINPFGPMRVEGDPSQRRLFCTNTGDAYVGTGMTILNLHNIRTSDVSTHPVDVVPFVVGPAPVQERILELFNASRAMQATNPRDKVYALLGVAKRPCYSHTDPHPGRREIIPRYQMSVEAVYLEASWYLLLTEQNLELLSSSQHRSAVNKNMPSWVTDWETLGDTNVLIAPLHEPGWRACGDSRWEVPETGLYMPTLTVQGWKTCTIVAAVQGEFCLSKAALIAADTPDSYQLVSSSQTRIEAFWRTLVADHVDRQNPAPQQCENEFMHLWASEVREARMKCEEGNKGISESAAKTVQRFERAEARLGLCSDSVTNTERPWAESQFCFIARFDRTSLSRTVFRTEENFLGNGPRRLRENDQVWILAGANVPMVLRPQASGYYQLVGEAYVHGIMNGEVRKDCPKLTITLV
ncbi:heterokaryon incompatibility protein-domain-containing protein [Nemania sp. FL0916]|nr:heterokaryon incompatibility protein-domain-containing protein [Nemania sp. FL0916]